MKRISWSVAAVLAAASAVWAQQATLPATPRPAGAAPAQPATVDHEAALAHYQKAKELFDKERYTEAETEVTAALAADPDLQDAKLLRLRIDSQKPNTGGTGAGTGANAGMLTTEQISHIRLAELGSHETGLRGSIPRKALEDFWSDVVLKDNTLSEREKSTAARSNFLNPSNFGNQVRAMQTEKAEKFLDQVKLDTDPETLKAYKTSVQPFLIQNCASCHKPDSGRKFLVFGAVGSVNDPQTYTNFYQLATYSKDGAMLDRQNPERSLLIQYSMPRKDAASPHPGEVEVTRKLISNTPPYREMVNWIKSLAFPLPDYAVKWTPTPVAAKTETPPAK